MPDGNYKCNESDIEWVLLSHLTEILKGALKHVVVGRDVAGRTGEHRNNTELPVTLAEKRVRRALHISVKKTSSNNLQLVCSCTETLGVGRAELHPLVCKLCSLLFVWTGRSLLAW